jgi:cyclic nucleotide-binding protein/4Fe-4S binding protein
LKAQLTNIRSLSFEDWVRGALIAAYLAIIIVCFTTNLGPRIFWTMALPLLIICIVLMGYNTWRRICPLAFWGTFGVRLKPKHQKLRRVPEWMERWFFMISLGLLVIMLIVRLLLINGDGILLGATLILVGMVAAFTNYFYSGRTWCNFICPVGTVERIYTDPNSLRMAGNSQCVKCTACKRHCPDIDQENAYWKDVTLLSRKISFYSFPGVVLGFYTYYFLRAGTWEAYYDGRWTRHHADLGLILGPGFFFAPQIPAVIAATLTMIVFMAVSYWLFLGIEYLISRATRKDEERSRHLTLSLAGFAAFNIFYLFAGAPTLRLIPGATRAVAFIVPLVSSIFLYKRWLRQNEDYVKVKSAKHLLPLWKSSTPPPQNPIEVFAYFQGKNEAHAAQVAAYEEVVREILEDGVVTPRELNLLGQMRVNLNISETEHRKIFAALSEEDRTHLDPAHATSVERRLQLQGYTSALTQLLMRNASTEELSVLRLDYGIAPEVHEAVLKELRGDVGPLTDRIQKQMDRLVQIRQWIASLSSQRQESLRTSFVIDLLFKSQERYRALILEALRPLGDTQFQDNLNQLLSVDRNTQATAWENIRKVLGAELADRLKSILEFKTTLAEDLPQETILKAMLASPDIYHRACTALLLGEQTSAEYMPLLHECLADEHPLVRETASHSAIKLLKYAAPEMYEAIKKDSKPNVQASLHLMRQKSEDPSITQVLSEAGKNFAALSTLEKMVFIHQVPLFADLNPDDLYELSGFAREAILRANETLVREGDTADELYIITNGQAEATVTRKGLEQVIGTASSGHVIGEMAVIDGQPRSATVKATSPKLQLLRIRGEDFRRVLMSRADLSAQVMRIISLRLRKVLDSF